MPATPAALRELRDRVAAIQWRINGLALASAFCKASAALLAAAAITVLAAYLAPPEIFGAIAGASGLAAMTSCALVAYRSWRGWVSLRAAARLADRTARLQDRLSTALWTAERAPAPRLAPLLVLDALERAGSWQPERIAPRRIPRAAVLPVLTLCALIAALIAVRRASREAMPQPASYAESAKPAPRDARKRIPRTHPLFAARGADRSEGSAAPVHGPRSTASGETALEEREQTSADSAGGEPAEGRQAKAGLAGTLQAMILGQPGTESPRSGQQPTRELENARRVSPGRTDVARRLSRGCGRRTRLDCDPDRVDIAVPFGLEFGWGSPRHGEAAAAMGGSRASNRREPGRRKLTRSSRLGARSRWPRPARGHGGIA